MATLRPTHVEPGPEHTTGVLVTPADVVGGDQAWSDDSDETYTLHSPYLVDEGGWVGLSAQARSYFDPTSEIADATIRVRLEVLDSAYFRTLDVFVTDLSVAEELHYAALLPADVPPVGVVGWVEIPGLAIRAEVAEAGFMLGINVKVDDTAEPRATEPRAVAKVYEVEIITALVRRRPSCIRHRQRGDGLGASSAPRGRQNSTQQASLRGRGIR